MTAPLADVTCVLFPPRDLSGSRPVDPRPDTSNAVSNRVESLTCRRKSVEKGRELEESGRGMWNGAITR